MKTVTLWDKADVQVGRMVTPTHRISQPWKMTNVLAATSYMIAFDPTAKVNPVSLLQTNAHYCLVTLLNGCITCQRSTKEELAMFLTKNDMIPMTYEQIIQTMRFLHCPNFGG